jgi:hypothetical protein
VPTFFRSSRFSLGGVSTRSKLPDPREEARNRLERGEKNQRQRKETTYLAEFAATFAPFLHLFFENHFHNFSFFADGIA